MPRSPNPAWKSRVVEGPLGGMVRSLRLSAGLSLSEVQRRSGVTSSFIGRLESGERTVGSDALLSILEVITSNRDLMNRMLVISGYAPMLDTPLQRLVRRVEGVVMDQDIAPRDKARFLAAIDMLLDGVESRVEEQEVRRVRENA